MALGKSITLSEEEKAELLESAQEHLRRAKGERDYYKQQVEAVVTANESEEPRIGHYSYDFVQQLHYPFNAQQTGPEYFKTARKCGLFGVCNDGKGQQVNYLIDEAQNPGKGADCVISLVDHYLKMHSGKVKGLYLHADNCTAQNKNNATMQYLLWRVMTGKNDSIELSFMLVGRSPLTGFLGFIKKIYRHSSVSTLSELVGVVEKSTLHQQNIAPPEEIRLNFDSGLLIFQNFQLNSQHSIVP